MPREPMMVAQAAEVIARAYGLSSPPAVAAQARHLLQMGALVPAARRGQGRLAAALLDDGDLCRFVLLTRLSGMGAVPETLRDGAACMHNIVVPAEASAPGVTASETGWPALIASMRRGDEWLFVFHLQQIGPAGGRFVRLTTDTPAEELIAPLPMRGNNAGTYLLAASDILRPLLNALAELPDD